MPTINKIRPDHIKLKRAYEPPAPDDGTPNIDRPIMAAADRIERETARYMNLIQMASASVKIIFDTVPGWRPGYPMREFEIMRSQPKDSTGRMEHPID